MDGKKSHGALIHELGSFLDQVEAQGRELLMDESNMIAEALVGLAAGKISYAARRIPFLTPFRFIGQKTASPLVIPPVREYRELLEFVVRGRCLAGLAGR